MCSHHKLQYYRSLSGYTHSGATFNFFHNSFSWSFLGLFTYFNYFEACSDRKTRLDFVLNMQCHNRIIFHWAEIRDFWKNPIKPEKARKNPKKPEKPDPEGFFRKTRVFSNPGYAVFICYQKKIRHPWEGTWRQEPVIGPALEWLIYGEHLDLKQLKSWTPAELFPEGAKPATHEENR